MIEKQNLSVHWCKSYRRTVTAKEKAQGNDVAIFCAARDGPEQWNPCFRGCEVDRRAAMFIYVQEIRQCHRQAGWFMRALKVNLDLFLVFVVGECVAFCLYIKHHNTYMHIIAGQKLQPGNCLSLRRQVKLFGCRHYWNFSENHNV